MKSETLPSFWKEYAKLNAELKQRARNILSIMVGKSLSPVSALQMRQSG
jgi:hypothetical protein